MRAISPASTAADVGAIGAATDADAGVAVDAAPGLGNSTPAEHSLVHPRQPLDGQEGTVGLTTESSSSIFEQHLGRLVASSFDALLGKDVATMRRWCGTGVRSTLFW